MVRDPNRFGGEPMIYSRPSTELYSLSVMSELIHDEGMATKVFADFCGVDREVSRTAVRKFLDKVRQDARWLDLLSQIDTSSVLHDPEAAMTLLCDGFGLSDLDAMDVVIRLCMYAGDAPPSAHVN